MRIASFFLQMRVSSAAASCAILAACSPKVESGSRVVIKMPDASQLSAASSKVFASSYSWDRACFAVNVIAPDIPGKRPNQCSVPVGINTGWAMQNGELSLDVPRGSQRNIEVFAHFRNAATDPCPTPDKRLDQLDGSKIVRIGSATFDVNEPIVNVAVEVELPAAGVTAVSQYGLSTTCSTRTVASSPGDGRIAPGRAVVSGGGLKIDGVVSASGSQVLTGTNGLKIELSRRVGQ